MKFQNASHASTQARSAAITAPAVLLGHKTAPKNTITGIFSRVLTTSIGTLNTFLRTINTLFTLRLSLSCSPGTPVRHNLRKTGQNTFSPLEGLISDSKKGKGVRKGVRLEQWLINIVETKVNGFWFDSPFPIWTGASELSHALRLPKYKRSAMADG